MCKICSIRFNILGYLMLWRSNACFCFNSRSDNVTAGVFFNSKMFSYYEYSEITLTFILFWVQHSVICFYTALYQNDIKRVIAYSHVVNLVIMMIACGLSSYDYAMYHLLITLFLKHFIFKCWFRIHALADDKICVKWVAY